MKVKCEKHNCNNNENNYCTRNEIILENIKYIDSGVCYHYETKASNIEKFKREYYCDYDMEH